jgi:hypothetical protein
MDSNSTRLFLNLNDIRAFDVDLVRTVMMSPMQSISTFEEVLKEVRAC